MEKSCVADVSFNIEGVAGLESVDVTFNFEQSPTGAGKMVGKVTAFDISSPINFNANGRYRTSALKIL